MESENLIICQNCENEIDLNFNYCPYCGQANKKQNLNFRFVFSEFLSANLNLDNKILLTLKQLIIAPGKLTIEYLSGKRSKYVTPIRLYLFISFVYFFVISLNLSKDDKLKTANDNKIVTYKMTDSLQTSNVLGIMTNDSVIDDNTGAKWLYDGIDNTFNDKSRSMDSEAGKIMFKESFRKYTSIGMFVLIPITALLLFWIFYKGTYYIEHLIFSFHLQSVFFLLFILFNIIGWFVDYDFISIIKWLLFLVILFLWIKKYYKRSIMLTVWRTIIFLFSYILVIVLFFTIIVLFSFLNLEGIKS